MTLRKFSHPIYLQWFKKIFAFLAFLYPSYMVLTMLVTSTQKNPTSIIILFVLAVVMMIPFLVAAYFFQDIWVDEEGLQIEFLWWMIRVRWKDIIEMKNAWGFWLASDERRPQIVFVKRLSPFHRVLGYLYGWSAKSGFVIYPSISDFPALKEIIQNHVNE